MSIGFVEKPGNILAQITIHDIRLERVVVHNDDPDRPPAVIYDPLAKIWGTLRKRIKERFGVSIAGAFSYDIDMESIACQFSLDFAGVDHDNGLQTYIGMFEDSFPRWADFFEQTVREFMEEADDGYPAYHEMVQKGIVDPEKYRLYFNRYFKARRLRTRADEKRSAEKRRQREELEQQMHHH